MAMSKLTKKDVEHIAKLARLPLTPQEKISMQKQLSEVVSYVGELAEVETSKVEPTSQTTGLTNVTREDQENNQSLSLDQVISGTDNTHNGYFVVPQILDKEDR
jgi:aspartyl-tRNA(Asn)/glutamyl-tRNA(Gln) amidotransferase subunit C